ncbi:MAG TPA: ATP-binding protein [Bryobacteraceae bacterium]|nr:ATP-binding protein [Bryobacteraceae bacterium]
MTRSRRFDCEMKTSLPASLAALEDFLAEFRRHSQAVLPAGNCFAAELLVREALTNAVMHGCGADPRKRVRCWLRLRKRRLLIAVADDGDGFDWRSGRHALAGSSDCSGRGMEILRRYADHVRFNHKGNVVTLTKRVDRGEQ